MVRLRDEVPNQEKWNVEALYPSTEEWMRDLESTKGFQELKSYKGKLKNPAVVKELLERYFLLDRKLAKLHTYAHLRLDEDLGNDVLKENFGKISSLVHDFQLENAWIEPEFLSLSEEEFQKIIDHPDLQAYRFFLEKIGRMRPHTLNAEEEELLALAGKALETPYRAFGALNNADLTFKPAVDSEGKERELTHGSYLSFLRGRDRELRKSAFENLHQGFESYANTICELIQGQVQTHLFSARARKFDSCLQAALFPHRIDEAVYSNLIAAVRNGFGTLHEYLDYRKSVLKLDRLHPYDLYVPLIDEVDFHMDYNEACDAIVQSVAPLGKEYQDVLKKGLLEERWVDIYENARKRSGAYSSGCYDSMPYILMNYQGTLNDVLTLAHEAGHSMHSYLSRTHQPYVYAQYPIFVAEVASTFNEQLLLKLLKERAKSKEEKAYLINYQIEGIRTTIFRQVLFSEFEWKLHQWAEEDMPLTPSLLKSHYSRLNQDYYGPEISSEPHLQIEWARIPHFYYNFYVYQYATGLSAAIALFKKVPNSEEARSRYLQFLQSGGSLFPLDLLELAGVDMKTPEPVHAAVQQFGELLKELKQVHS